MKKLFLVLATLLAVPALGLAVSLGITAHLDSKMAEDNLPGVQSVCSDAGVRAEPNLAQFCEEVDNLALMRDASYAVGAGVIALPIFYWICSAVIGSSRAALAWFFPHIVRLSLLALAGIVLVQGGILVSAVMIGESYIAGQVHVGLLFFVGLGALVACGTLLSQALILGRKQESVVDGRVLKRETHPKIFKIVEEVAKKLNAHPPNNIVAGLEPTFFATSARVRVPGEAKALKGETLFVSLPLSRVLSVEEFVAVLGHELGHFRGKDTAYSLKFAPVYAGLSSALHSIGSRAENGEAGGAMTIPALPAISLLSFMLEVFARNESKISRVREFAADKTATEVAPPQALAAALMKIALLAPLWPSLVRMSGERINKGAVFQNLSVAFGDYAQFDLDPNKVQGLLGEILETRITHPTDSHPPIGERVRALGLNTDNVNVNGLLTTRQPASVIFDELDELEKGLSMSLHKAMVSAGVCALPDENEQSDDERTQNALHNCCYVLLAVIVNSSGGLTEGRVAAADGGGLLSQYDRFTMREVCQNPADWIKPIDAIDTLGHLLNENGRRAVLVYLHAVLMAEPGPTDDARGWFAFIEQKLSEPIPELGHAAGPHPI